MKRVKNSNQVNFITKLITVLTMAIVLTACSGDNAEKYNFCVYMERETCLLGPFETCANGGMPSNSCPSGYDKGSQPSSSSGYTGEYGSFSYQGQTYKTVQIGTQTWMAENLNYNVEGSKCYDNDPSNCAKYGRLYDWATAMALSSSCNSAICSSQVLAKHKGICPLGWHIPSNDEWSMLENYVGGSSVAGKHLKATNGWNDYNGQPGNGTDSFGFAALPGGQYTSYGDVSNVGLSGYWFSASEYEGNNAYSRIMTCAIERNNLGYGIKKSLFSVRCVED